MAKNPTPQVETSEEAAAAEKLAKRQAAAAKAAKTRAANAAKRAAAKEAAEQAKLEKEKATLQAKLGALEPAAEAEGAKTVAAAASPKKHKAKASAPKVSVADASEQAAEPVAEVAPEEAPEAKAQHASVENWIQRINAWLDNAFPSNKNAVLGGIAGLLVACLFFALGFWKTLFIVVLVLIGVAVGQIADGDPKLVRTINKLTKKH